MKRIGIVSLWVLLVLIMVSRCDQAAFADGPNRVFSGGPCVRAAASRAEPDWAFVNETPTIELQLLDPVRRGGYGRRLQMASSTYGQVT